MRNILVFLMLFASNLMASTGYSQIVRFDISMHNMTLEQLFKEIEEKSEFSIIYKSNEVNLKERVSVNAKEQPVDVILDNVLKKQGLKYTINDRHIIIYKSDVAGTDAEAEPAATRQNRKTITGIVKDERGEAVIGASIFVKGQTTGTITNIDGEFSLDVSENATIVISYIGYNSQEIVVGSTTSFNIILKEDAKQLDEVVVTALGIKRSEKALGYSVQKVGGEELTAVKGVDVATSLTGKIAGVTILNKNDFNTAPTILLRGESPLIVVDGVPFENIDLSYVSADDIASIDVLKGATASALYGSKGQSGAVMITTKRGNKEGLSVSVNSNTMLNMGYLVLPEVQSAYSSGSGGKYLQEDSEYIWGDKLDIGRVSKQYDPYTYEWRDMELVSKGKDNFKNFLETSFITNNNVNVTYKGKNGSVRTSLTHVYNKGQFPGNKLNKFTYTVAGDMKVGKFSLDASITYNLNYTPQRLGSGYGTSAYMYNMIVWTGTEFDVREFKDYWVAGKEDEQQNWHYKNDYNNPYFLANEVTRSRMINTTNAQFTANYEFTDWLKGTARVGTDYYSQKDESKTPVSHRNDRLGAFSMENHNRYSVTGDAILMVDKKVGDFNVGGIIGGGINYSQRKKLTASTNGGLEIPGYYSLKASKNLPSVTPENRKLQTNSLYGKIDLSWKSAIFLEVTGRNDWVSTLEESERSYFYPSVSGSVILSELLELPRWMSFAKLRSSWTMTKKPAAAYAINKVYTITQNVWDGKSMANYPTTIRDVTLVPEKTNSFEIGAVAHFFDNRLRLDVAYYTKLLYDIQLEAPVSNASGFTKSFINIDEERIKKGWEVTVSGDIFKSKDFTWTSSFNWGLDRLYYKKIDDTYSVDKPWVKKGERADWFTYSDWNGMYDWQRDPEGNIIHSGGMPVLSSYTKKIGHQRADWVWGFTNHLSYKSFTLDVSFDGRVGGKAYNRLEQAMWNSGTHIKSDNQWRYDQVVNGNTSYIGEGVKVVSGSVKYDSYGNILEDTRIFAPNDVAVTYEAYTKSYNPWNGSARIQNVHDLTFFKLRELSIGYKLPLEVISKIGLKNAHLSLVGQNLFIWAKSFKYSDPDAIYQDHNEVLNAPSMRYVGLNIKVDF